MTRLRIVIVNWNAGTLLRDCVHSIEGAVRDGFVLEKLVIVDNGSTDDSLYGLSSSALRLEIIANSRNMGFASACNQGAQGCNAEYLLFLNPDTRLYADSLTVPLAFMERKENKSVGICGIQLIDASGEISRSCARFPEPATFLSAMLGMNRLAPRVFKSHFMSEWDHKENRQVDQVIGAFFLLRQKLFEQLDGFDERFFVYFEDLDFSFRAHQSGWSTWYLADAHAYHKGGGTSEQIKATRLFYSLRSRILYGYKHFPAFQASLLLLGTLCIEPVTRMAFSLLRGEIRSVGETFGAYLMLYRAMPEILTLVCKK